LVVDSNREHLAAIRADGLRIEGAFTATARLRAVHIEELGEELELVVLAVKTRDVDPVLNQISGALRPDSKVVTLQNGLVAHEVAGRIAPGSVFPGSVAYAGHLIGPGRIRHGADGDIAIGGYTAEHEAAAKLVVEALSPFGQVGFTSNIWGRIWGKTAIAVLLAAAAVDGRPTHEVFADRRARRVLHRLIGETVATAVGEGVELEPVKGIDLSRVNLETKADDPEVERQFGQLVEVAKSGLPHKTHSGTWYNLKVSRQSTETAELLGPIIDRAMRRGVEPRALRNLRATIQRLEDDPSEMSPALMEELA
jgi:2-dehydropantoate 2-reductase